MRDRCYYTPGHGDEYPRPKNQWEAKVVHDAKALLNTPVIENGKPKLNPHPGGVLVLPEGVAPEQLGAEVITPELPAFEMKLHREGKRLLDPKDLPRLSLGEGDATRLGLVKLDYLSSKHLPLLMALSDAIWGAQVHGRLAFEDKVNLEDESIYEMAAQPMAWLGVFQVQGSAIGSKLNDFKPKRFMDLALLSASIRPGVPLDELMQRRAGQAEALPPHPCLAELLEPTYGIMVFQEQLMLGLQLLADFNLAEAASVIKAVSKKVPAELAKYKRAFNEGFKRKHGGDGSRLWAVYERMSGYGFSLAHSAAYAVTCAWELWAKANHPLTFVEVYAKLFGEDKANPIRRGLGLPVVRPVVTQPTLGL